MKDSYQFMNDVSCILAILILILCVYLKPNYWILLIVIAPLIIVFNTEALEWLNRHDKKITRL